MSNKRYYDEAVEALRKAICALPRYSFILNSCGGVSRTTDSSGRWIEWAEVHKLFDPEVVDTLVAESQAAAVITKASKSTPNKD